MGLSIDSAQHDSRVEAATRDTKGSGDVQQFVGLLRSALPGLADRYGVKSLAVFGSYVRNEQSVDSDLDVLVEFSRTPTLFDLVHLADELSERLGVKVDLVPKQSLRRTIGQHILTEAVPV